MEGNKQSREASAGSTLAARWRVVFLRCLWHFVLGAVLSVVAACLMNIYLPMPDITRGTRAPVSSIETWRARTGFPEPYAVVVATSTGSTYYQAVREDAPDTVEVMHLFRVGFPFRALQGSENMEARGAAGRRTAHTLHSVFAPNSWPLQGFVMKTNVSYSNVMPYDPLWLGLIANAAIWGLATLGLKSLVKMWVCWRRLRRGLCVACAYELRLLAVCPECGTARGAGQQAPTIGS